jgi:hypothetical protein
MAVQLFIFPTDTEETHQLDVTHMAGISHDGEVSVYTSAGEATAESIESELTYEDTDADA